MVKAPSVRQPAPARKTIGDVGEFGLIEIIKGIVPWGDSSLVVGIGDDTAAFRPTPGMLTLATCDIQVEGRHFILGRISPTHLGRRAAAINLSDIAAMGGQPRYALVSLALPATVEVSWIEDFYRGLKAQMGEFGAAVIGGNLSASAGPIIIDITLLGEAKEDHILRRSGGRPGDVVLVTGSLGSAAAGLCVLEGRRDPGRAAVAELVRAHHTPTPRVREGMFIAQSGKATAMLDISDGLAGDLGHLCDASGVGARVFAESLPILPSARDAAREAKRDALDLALQGGDDYELCLSCRPEDAAALAVAVKDHTGTVVTQVGVLTEAPGLVLVLSDGRETPLARGGWDHFAPKGR